MSQAKNLDYALQKEAEAGRAPKEAHAANETVKQLSEETIRGLGYTEKAGYDTEQIKNIAEGNNLNGKSYTTPAGRKVTIVEDDVPEGRWFFPVGS